MKVNLISLLLILYYYLKLLHCLTFLVTSYCLGHSSPEEPCFGLCDTGGTLVNMTGFQKRPWKRWNWSSCPSRRDCGTRVGSARGFRGTQQHPLPAWRWQERMEETQACSWQWCMAGWWEAVAQIETWESQTEDKEKTFPQWDTPVIRLRTRKAGLSQFLGVSHCSCMRSWAAWCEPMAEIAWGKGWDHGLPRSSLAQIALLFLWYIQT